MKKSAYLKIVTFFLFSMLLVSVSFADGPEIPKDWTMITPGPTKYMGRNLTPTCSGYPDTNPEFSFFVKGGTVNNLVIFFDGGGACWDSNNCLYYPTYTMEVTETVDLLSGAGGIFDLRNPTNPNPFKDWSFVFIPYCTGDIHVGSSDHEYPGPSGQNITIHHRGFDNFLVVLKWITKNFKQPHNIFVTGTSAGGYGAIFGFPHIKEAFPRSSVYVLGDAANGVLGEDFKTRGIYNWNIQLPEWIPGFKKGYNPDLTMDFIYEKIAAYYPLSKLAQYTTAWDNNQTFFYNVMLNINDPANWANWPLGWCEWHNKMLGYTHETAAEAPNYRYYIGAGMDHGIMVYDKFYEEDSAGVSFVDWVNAMVGNHGGTHGHGGTPWENSECVDCNPPPISCP